MRLITLVSVLRCGLLLAFFTTTTSADILIDFDTAADGSTIESGDVLTNQYAAWGVTFSAFDNGLPVTSVVLNDGPVYGNGWVNLSTTDLVPLDVLRVDFAAPVQDVRWLMSPLGVETEFRAYDAFGVLLESLKVTSYDRVAAQFSVAGISRMEGHQIDNTFWGLDDLEFSPVPEPSTVVSWTLGVATIWIGLRRRRKRLPQPDKTA